jgi:hypothetical protein
LRELLQSKRIYFLKYILLEIVFTEYVHDEYLSIDYAEILLDMKRVLIKQ